MQHFNNASFRRLAVVFWGFFLGSIALFAFFAYRVWISDPWATGDAWDVALVNALVLVACLTCTIVFMVNAPAYLMQLRLRRRIKSVLGIFEDYELTAGQLITFSGMEDIEVLVIKSSHGAYIIDVNTEIENQCSLVVDRYFVANADDSAEGLPSFPYLRSLLRKIEADAEFEAQVSTRDSRLDTANEMQGELSDYRRP